MSFSNKMYETLRDKARDRLCVALRRMEIDAQLADLGREEEDTAYTAKVHAPGFLRKRHRSGSSGRDSGGSLGIIDIADSLIHWINVCVVDFDPDNPTGGDIEHYNACGVPDPRVTDGLSSVLIETMRMKSPSLLGKVVDLHWEGDDLGLSIIDRLNADSSLKNMIMRSRDMSIATSPRLHCWLLITTSTRAPSMELWQGYQRIAHHLLETSLS